VAAHSARVSGLQRHVTVLYGEAFLQAQHRGRCSLISSDEDHHTQDGETETEPNMGEERPRLAPSL
jgi:ferric-dicitrate binding protein FerR (iron transport regulator)